MQLLRSWMFVPGHQQKMINKALGLKLDVAIFDLEDGVPPAEKDTARNLVTGALVRPPGVPLRFVRIHAVGSAEMEQDIQAVIRPGLDGLVLPKVETPEDVRRIDEILNAREPKSGRIRLLATIESARGLIQAPAIAAASPRLVGLMFGAEDFALDLGIFGDPSELLYPRSAVVVAAASERLQAIDRIYTDFRNPDGLIQDTRQARELGFTGKALIHPAQIEPVHKVFRPTAEEVEYARRVVEAFEKTEGAIAVDGKMVDLPIVERARRVLQLMGEQT
jgi:citrate lyase subunit beta / citryl-CoA lyase